MQKLTKYIPTIQPEKWYVVDVTNVRLGKLATNIAQLLLGKNDPKTVDYVVNKTKVVIINADKLSYYPSKGKTKLYTRYSGFPGGLSTTNLEDMMQKDSRKVVLNAISGMLPKTKLRDKYLTNLFVYKDEKYIQTAQQPESFKIN